MEWAVCGSSSWRTTQEGNSDMKFTSVKWGRYFGYMHRPAPFLLTWLLKNHSFYLIQIITGPVYPIRHQLIRYWSESISKLFKNVMFQTFYWFLIGQTCPVCMTTVSPISCPNLTIIYTVFRRINTPGADAQNEPLALSDSNETHRVTHWVP